LQQGFIQIGLQTPIMLFLRLCRTRMEW